MSTQAVALCRVSTKGQEDEGHSLESQESNVLQAANDLDTEIIKVWSLSKSRRKSRTASEMKKKDLEEILSYCKQNKRVRYLIIDKVNRLMREIDVFYYYIVEFRMIDVQVHFAAPEQADLNTNDQLGSLKRFLAIYEAETDNVERSNTTTSRMKSRVKEGYYPFNVKQGYIKSDTPGIHIPDPQRFESLQRAAREVLERQFTPGEALKRLNDSGYTTQSGKPLRIDKFKLILTDPYYASINAIRGWEQQENALRQPMFSKGDLDELRMIIEGRKVRYARKKHNPDFPLANRLHSSDCEDGGKFAGFFKVNGKQNGWKSPKYRCRGCQREYNREALHDALSDALDHIELHEPTRNRLLETIKTIWATKQKARITEIKHLKTRLIKENQSKSDLIIAIANPGNLAIRDDLQSEVARMKQQIASTEAEIENARDVEADLVEFARFALNYLARLKDNYWDLEHEERVWCENMLFPGGIYFNSEQKVHTPQITSLFALMRDFPTKKEPDNVSDSLLVEHLEKSSPLIIEEVRRWRDLLWDDYLDYKYREKRSIEVHNP